MKLTLKRLLIMEWPNLKAAVANSFNTMYNEKNMMITEREIERERERGRECREREGMRERDNGCT